MRRASLIALLVGLPILVLGSVAVAEYWPHDPPPPLPAPRDPLLPDLAMPQLTDVLAAGIQGQETQQLFFSASIANIGPGPFMINAVRGDERGGWRVSQRFQERDGATTEAATPADMTWGGHGHEHWHVRIGASYRLFTLPSMRQVRSLEKVGFCFFDQRRFDPSLPAAPKTRMFPKTACDGESTLALDMGLSPGWDDPYSWALPDQRLGLTGLPDGRYRLIASADPNNWFRETNEKNNETWLDLELRTSSYPPRATVLRIGAHASPKQDP
jgi:hypothetical protein